jgi:hypothetical protein
MRTTSMSLGPVTVEAKYLKIRGKIMFNYPIVEIG